MAAARSSLSRRAVDLTPAMIQDILGDFGNDSEQEEVLEDSSESEDELWDSSNSDDEQPVAGAQTTNATQVVVGAQNQPTTPSIQQQVEGLVWEPDESFTEPHCFTGNPGQKVNVQDVGDILQYFELFLDEACIAQIVLETNEFAFQLQMSKVWPPHARIMQWKDTTPAEILVYFALLIMISIIGKPRIEYYWSRDFFLINPIFSQLMSLRRFQLLKRCLHFCDNTNMRG
jgi:hypothetical protein